MTAGHSLWMGGLCRIDVIDSETNLFVNPFVSREVSLLGTTILKANKDYLSNFDKQ
jgi:hypothetical protein